MLIVAWETTAACNLKCSYCRAFASATPDSNELGTKEAKAFIKSIASLQPMLILSGGEPLLRPDIFQLASYATSLGLRVSLASNGTLITPEVVHQIKASGISRVSISLDGSTADKHDQNRGIGSFQAAIKGVENLRGNVDFQVNFTITNKNESEVLSIFDLAEAKGAKALHFFFHGSHWPGARRGSDLGRAARGTALSNRPRARAKEPGSPGHLCTAVCTHS